MIKGTLSVTICTIKEWNRVTYLGLEARGLGLETRRLGLETRGSGCHTVPNNEHKEKN
jgi:hypothetical protein